MLLDRRQAHGQSWGARVAASAVAGGKRAKVLTAPLQPSSSSTEPASSGGSPKVVASLQQSVAELSALVAAEVEAYEDAANLDASVVDDSSKQQVGMRLAGSRDQETAVGPRAFSFDVPFVSGLSPVARTPQPQQPRASARHNDGAGDDIADGGASDGEDDARKRERAASLLHVSHIICMLCIRFAEGRGDVGNCQHCSKPATHQPLSCVSVCVCVCVLVLVGLPGTEAGPSLGAGSKQAA